MNSRLSARTCSACKVALSRMRSVTLRPVVSAPVRMSFLDGLWHGKAAFQVDCRDDADAFEDVVPVGERIAAESLQPSLSHIAGRIGDYKLWNQTTEGVTKKGRADWRFERLVVLS